MEHWSGRPRDIPAQIIFIAGRSRAGSHPEPRLRIFNSDTGINAERGEARGVFQRAGARQSATMAESGGNETGTPGNAQ